MMTLGVTRLPGLEAAAHTMPFDQFGRYHMLREAVDACRTALGRERLRILDVGGFFRTAEGDPTLPLTRFLPDDDIQVVDTVDCALPGYLKGDGSALPFPDGDVDLVVSADTLEHIPQFKREAFWHELLRVAQHGVILLAPFSSPEVTLAEDVLFHYIKAELHGEQPQLKEHREYGLPMLEDWLTFLVQEGYTARAYPTGYLNAWLSMMLFKHTLIRMEADLTTQQLPDTYYNLVFFPTERRAPAYRHLIMVEKTVGLVAAVDAVLAATIMPAQQDASVEWGSALLPTYLAILERQLGARHQQQDKHLDHVHRQLDRALEQIDTLQGMMAAHERLLIETQRRAAKHDTQPLHQGAQYEQTIHDLTERVHWLEGQNKELRRLLAAIQNGRIMRLLRLLHSTGTKRLH